MSKASGHAAKVSFFGHALMENRNGQRLRRLSRDVWPVQWTCSCRLVAWQPSALVKASCYIATCCRGSLYRIVSEAPCPLGGAASTMSSSCISLFIT